jgi:twitching motility protein PilI
MMPMDEIAATDPVSILRDIEEACRICNTTDFQHSAEIFSEWSGIAFRTGSNSLLAPLDEVVEILDMPKLARVPLAQPWVRGIANIRGNLLPVVDFSGFLGGEVATVTEKTRVLVIDYDGIYSGLVVDEVYGLKHFMESEHTDEAPEVDGFLLPFIRNGYRRDGRVWREFSLFALADTAQFLQTAA